LNNAGFFVCKLKKLSNLKTKQSEDGKGNSGDEEGEDAKEVPAWAMDDQQPGAVGGGAKQQQKKKSTKGAGEGATLTVPGKVVPVSRPKAHPKLGNKLASLNHTTAADKRVATATTKEVPRNNLARKAEPGIVKAAKRVGS
jgi:hypothetical protein